MEERQPILELKGVNGKLGVYDGFIRFTRKALLGLMTQGLKGKKDIYFKSITAIQIKKPGLTSGYIQVSILGGNESRGGVLAATKDENSLMFRGLENYRKAQDIKELIGRNIGIIDIKPSYNEADEIEKLYSLMVKGILSKEEFEEKKKKILDI